MSGADVTVIPVPPVQVTVQAPAPVQVICTPSLIYAGVLDLDSPNFTGAPTSSTAAPGTNTTQLATCEFVDKATRFTFTQQVAATVWTIVHNMAKYPTFVIIDSAGDPIMGAVDYVDINTLELTFSAPISGNAYLT